MKVKTLLLLAAALVLFRGGGDAIETEPTVTWKPVTVTFETYRHVGAGNPIGELALSIGTPLSSSPTEPLDDLAFPTWTYLPRHRYTREAIRFEPDAGGHWRRIPTAFQGESTGTIWVKPNDQGRAQLRIQVWREGRAVGTTAFWVEPDDLHGRPRELTATFWTSWGVFEVHFTLGSAT